jgi:hypothetical protein
MKILCDSSLQRGGAHGGYISATRQVNNIKGEALKNWPVNMSKLRAPTPQKKFNLLPQAGFI